MHFNWLHFTDLHCGMREDRWLWDTVLERLRKDLAILQPRCGAWDLILFTGDLTDRGTRAQFDELDAGLTRLGDCIAALQGGRQPILLAVPGNHDLQRPETDDEGLSVLAAWLGQPRLPQVFWDKPDAVACQTIDTAFAEYRAWWDRRVAPQLGTEGRSN
ncbi:metallophosphoesterase family protein [Candidatus Thiodictyon syntrophicum]|uniref:metallophosphoesterase family protein n=1 Tax=Candidatus Thiodictyon syntrophicum TaxID=1166950 RepID=UPI0012FD6FE9|nr:metallophosphoesterase [Candidatus Thiodictyon syntrophicum]